MAGQNANQSDATDHLKSDADIAGYLGPRSTTATRRSLPPR
jgi:hypothetical protein